MYTACARFPPSTAPSRPKATALPAVSSDEVEFELQTECRSSSPSRTVAYHVTYCRYSGDSSQCQGVSLREICESKNSCMYMFMYEYVIILYSYMIALLHAHMSYMYM